ncbi:MAG TPA: triose-phosphate isomerase [Patescibacteria group bacterium]|nr:triose-phosphate isomerase [Patescibacteria group bacterium]
MKKLIVANWKMQVATTDGLFFLKQIANFSKFKNDLIVCPDFLILLQAGKILENTQHKLGAQNCSLKEKGALTGEISPRDLRLAGCSHVIIGHSERRHIFKEDSTLINSKIQVALNNDLIPILCLGESWLERRSGRTRPVLSAQLKSALKGIKIKKSSDLILAYEPVWAIGSGKSLAPEEADKIINYISDRALKLNGKRFKVLYGGSINEDNASIFLLQKNIAGLLVGGASTQELSLKKLLKA